MNASIKKVIEEISYEGNLPELQKRMGNEGFSNAVTMEAANRTLNLQIHERLKQIATGEAKPAKVTKSKAKVEKTEQPKKEPAGEVTEAKIEEENKPETKL